MTKTPESAFELFPITNTDLYRLVLMNTLVASAAFTAFNLIIKDLDKGDKEDYKIKLMATWEKAMNEDFQSKVLALSNLQNSGKLENVDLLPQPEEFQAEFNKMIKSVKNMAAKALWPENFN